MRLESVLSESEFRRISELDVNPLASTTPAATGSTTMAPDQQVQQDPAAQAKMQAQQALDRANRKKDLQDQIRQTQKQLQDLQKELASLK